MLWISSNFGTILCFMSPGKKLNDSKLFFRILLVTSFGTPCRSQCICAFVCMCLFIYGCVLCMSLRLCVWAPLQMVMVARHGMVSPLSPLATVHPLKHSRFTLFLPFPRFTCFFPSVYIFPALFQTYVCLFVPWLSIEHIRWYKTKPTKSTNKTLLAVFPAKLGPSANS